MLGQGHFFSYSNLTLFQAQLGICISQGTLVASNRRQLWLALKGDYFGIQKSNSESVKKKKGKTYRPTLGKDMEPEPLLAASDSDSDHNLGLTDSNCHAHLSELKL